jgi:aminoglycoside phosphotransferase (APT) family kinase protein
MKGGGNVLSCEAKTLKLIESNSCIRTPRVHRSFQLPDPTKYFGTVGYIVMDYISGQSLDKLWRDLTNESRLDIASQTARMILELQSIEIQTPGPINGGPCRGRFFTDYSAGPFKNKYEMEDWFNHKLDICKKYNQASPDVPPFRFTNFVLTHQDISPRNLILDRDGLVWLVDWADAGAYPPAFESAALSSQQSYPDFSAMVLSFIPSYPTDHVQLQSIAYGLKTAAFA